jgi:tRNA U55 pseudouridine synthase TruB
MTEKRYVATVEMFVFETDDWAAEMMARSIAKDIASKYDNQACMVEIRHQPFGEIKQGESIKLKQ